MAEGSVYRRVGFRCSAATAVVLRESLRKWVFVIQDTIGWQHKGDGGELSFEIDALRTGHGNMDAAERMVITDLETILGRHRKSQPQSSS